MKKSNSKRLLYSAAVLGALTVGAVTATTPGTAVHADTSTETVPATQNVPIDAAHFPDAGLRALLISCANAAVEMDSLPSAETANWDGKSLTPTMLQWQTLQHASYALEGNVHDLTGLEVFTKLDTVDVSGMPLDSLKGLQPATSVVALVINYDQAPLLSALKDNGLTALKVINQTNTRTDTLDLSAVPDLETLSLSGGTQITEEDGGTRSVDNQWLKQLVLPATNKLQVLGLTNISHLTSLDYAALHDLTSLYLSDVTLGNDGKLDLSAAPNLASLTLMETNTSDLKLSDSGKLTTLRVSDGQLKALDLSGQQNLKQLDLRKNQISSLDVADLTNLQLLDVAENQLSELATGKLTKLMELDVFDNQLSELELNAPNLVILNASNNQLSGDWDLSNRPELAEVDLDGNQLTTINLSNDPELQVATLNDNQLTSVDFSHSPKLMVVATDNNHLTHYDVNSSLALATAIKGGAGPELTGYGQTVDAGMYQVNGHWYVDLAALTGNSDSSYYRISDNNWVLDDRGVAEYQGSGVPTTLTYQYMALHMPGLTPNIAFFLNLETTLTLTEAEAHDLALNFYVAADADGTYHGQLAGATGKDQPVSQTIPADEQLTASLVPGVVADNGYVLDHWEDGYGKVVDINHYLPTTDTALYAVLRKATEKDYVEQSGYNDGFADGYSGDGARALAAKADAYIRTFNTGFDDGKAAYTAEYEAGQKAGEALVGAGEQLRNVIFKDATKTHAYWLGMRDAYVATAKAAGSLDPSKVSQVLQADLALGLGDRSSDVGDKAAIYTSMYASAAKDAEAAAAAGKADAEAGKAQTLPENTAYAYLYVQSYVAVADAAAGTAAGTADAKAGAYASNPGTKSLAYREAYDAAYAAEKKTGSFAAARQALDDAAAGEAAGQAAGAAGEASADVTAQSQAYQTAYAAAYAKAKAAYDSDFALGQAAGAADYAAGEPAGTADGETAAYVAGYEAGYQAGVQADADALADQKAAGAAAGTKDGAAAADPADNTDQSQAYRDGYEAAYAEALATYQADFAAGELAGFQDAENGAKADVTAQSAGYQAGYAAGYDLVDAATTADPDVTATTAAEEATAGQKAGFADGAKGVAAADVTAQSAAYQAAYTGAYALAKKAYDFGQYLKAAAVKAKAAAAANAATKAADAKAGRTAGFADAATGKAQADLSGQSAAYATAYQAAYAQVTNLKALGAKVSDAKKAALAAAAGKTGDGDTTAAGDTTDNGDATATGDTTGNGDATATGDSTGNGDATATGDGQATATDDTAKTGKAATTTATGDDTGKAAATAATGTSTTAKNDQAAKQSGDLPQTGTMIQTGIAALGAAMLALMGFFGLKRKQRR
ncbi:leucine-rich repeat domain-containing protein [Lacticaseibacillus parakribbianus]|uniref:leucine-rich repeat domain-containing protein n=1 Tax=Lacticaseibacillus parakribbianus TaxID=2970927 RepID=UPI0021CB21FD|nr:leucine-rich repeat domain-containing protein [Lacticaseibacillus parakribbianus]